MTQVAGVGVIGLEHPGVGRRKNRVGPHHVLQTLVDPRHVALQTTVTGRAGGVASVSGPSRLGSEPLVTPQADRLILGPGPRPAAADTLVRVVAVDALQLRIARSTGRVGVLDRIPRPHPRGKLGPRPRVATAAGPVHVRVVAARVDLRSRGLGEQVRTAGSKPGQLSRILGVTPTAQVTCLATDPQRDAVLSSIHAGQLATQLLQLLLADQRGPPQQRLTRPGRLRFQELAPVPLDVGRQAPVHLPRCMPCQPQRLAGEHVAQSKRGVAAVAALGIGRKSLQLARPGKWILAVQFGQLAVHMHHRHPLPTIQPVSERQHVVGGVVLVAGRFRARGETADVVLVEPGTDRLSDPVGPVDLPPHQPHPPAGFTPGRLAVAEKRRAAAEMMQSTGS